MSKPMILAPAGSRASFLAAVAAGADAIYCGLKQYSARMEAKNFSLEELAALTELAHQKGTRVYVALNTLLKTDELDHAGSILTELSRTVEPDALIFQDPSLVPLVRQTGFSGKLILSTLANVSFPNAVKWVKEKLAVDHVVVPRELDIDEVKLMANACPKGMSLEVFVHGALCYGVSGRCYWSSYMGGKSGLRGRCVQPCRRLYQQRREPERSFSCMDLSLDVLVKVLKEIPQVQGWKIEGRKKGPHYVYYTVRAYQLLRDHGHDPQAKKSALGLLSMALGREGTHYFFLPQRPQNPIGRKGRTGSGLFIGKLRGGHLTPYLMPAIELFSGDVLRLGYEDEPGHAIHRIRRSIPPKGRLVLKPLLRRKSKTDVPVFLIDRRERLLEEMLNRLEAELPASVEKKRVPAGFKAQLPKKTVRKAAELNLQIFRRPMNRPVSGSVGYWLSETTMKAASRKNARTVWWCLPPVIWPKDEGKFSRLVSTMLQQGQRNFILNAPWQAAFFQQPSKLNLWAGPFCNLSNPLAIQAMAEVGFSGVIVSPELGREDYVRLPELSPLPLGIVTSGNWPLCVSRIQAQGVKPEVPFESPKKEQAWVKQYDRNDWVFPNWEIDIRSKIKLLRNAGYRLLVELHEPLPRSVKMKRRPGLWNWDLGLK